MRHLKPHEFTELLDGRLPTSRAAHASDCDLCRTHAETLRETWQRAAGADVPEPSPLFWEHFASRVRDAIDTPAPDSGGRTAWLHRPAAAWTVSALLATLVLALAFGRALVPPTAAPSRAGESAVASQAAGAQIGETEPPAPSPLERDVEADDAWALVRVVADEVGWDDAQAAGLVAAAESVERLALELNDAERIELARLLEDELKRSGV